MAFGKLLALAGSAIVGTGIYFSNLNAALPIPAWETTEQQNVPQEETAEIAKTELDIWLGKLVLCESGGNPNAVGDSGLARGILQFHKSTFVGFAEKYRLYPNAEKAEIENFYLSSEDQLKLATLMLTREKEGWRHWLNCTKQLGLPPR